MGRKIFVSYKYADDQVLALESSGLGVTTPRHYVDVLQDLLDDEDHVNKGEEDEESLADLSEDTIEEKLRDRIFDSTLTIAMLSPRMRDRAPDVDQWMPWEISYSLKKKVREDKTSKPNALLGIVLPDASGSYDYQLTEPGCATCKCRTISLSGMFDILKNNIFNSKSLVQADVCSNHNGEGTVYTGSHSYLEIVRWEKFIDSDSHYIDAAYERNERWEDYEVAVKI